MKIVEDEAETAIVPGVTKSLNSNAPNPTSSPIDYDFANLIIPNKIFPSKLSKLKSNFVLNKNVSDKNKQETNTKSIKSNGNAGLIIPTHNSQSKPKITEYRNGVIIEEL